MHSNGSRICTRQQLEHLRAIAAGETMQQTARRLHLSPATVKSHRANLYRRLGVDSAPLAVALGYYAGLLDCEEDPREIGA